MFVNGKQITITCHVDNLKITHVDKDEVTKVRDWMKVMYGSHMKEPHIIKYDYLIMEIDLSVYGEVRVTITDYLKKIISESTDTIKGW